MLKKKRLIKKERLKPNKKKHYLKEAQKEVPNKDSYLDTTTTLETLSIKWITDIAQKWSDHNKVSFLF